MKRAEIVDGILNSNDLFCESADFRWLWLGLILLSDKDGYLPYSPTWLNSAIMVGINLPEEEIESAIQRFEEKNMVEVLFEEDLPARLRVINKKKYQQMIEDSLAPGFGNDELVNAFIQKWNEIAEYEHLIKVRKITEKRQKSILKALRDAKGAEKFWPEVQEALVNRNEWAMEKKFPDFDQLLDVRLRTRLIEGKYRSQPDGTRKW